MEKIDILLVEDRKLVRKGIASILREFPRTGIIEEASNGLEMIDLLKKWKPHVILMDLEMPEMDGLDATSYVIKHFESIKIIGLSFHHEEKFILHMIELGAHGYLLKDSDPDELREAIESVVDKDFYYNELMVKTMRDGVRKHLGKPKFYPELALTSREKDILKYICQELSSKEIADKIFLSPRTIEKIRANLIEKIGVKGTVGLVKFAIEHGYDF